MNQQQVFSDQYGSLIFIMEAAKSGVMGTLEEVRMQPMIEVLNLVAYERSQANIINEQMLAAANKK